MSCSPSGQSDWQRFLLPKSEPAGVRVRALPQPNQGAVMGLPRTFVGFSSTDRHMYELMGAWRKNTHLDFNFADCQLNMALDADFGERDRSFR